MKPLFTFFACCFVLLNALQVSAQVNFDQLEIDEKYLYQITTASGNEIVGHILHMDARELIVRSAQMGEVIIPKYEITEIKRLTDARFTSEGEYIQEQDFATRYFFTTNGLPIEKGEDYIVWNIWGPDIHFSVGKNTSVGVLTSWLGTPVVGSIKHSLKISEKAFFGAGLYLGTGSWAAPNFGIISPYGALTLGSRRANISFSLGYTFLTGEGDGEGSLLTSVAAITPINNKVSFAFESFIFPAGAAVVTPGIRIRNKRGGAFQLGLGGVISESGSTFVPLPAIQWMRKF